MLGIHKVGLKVSPGTQILLIFILYVSIFACASLYHVHAVSVKAYRGQRSSESNEVIDSCLCLASPVHHVQSFYRRSNDQLRFSLGREGKHTA